MPSMIAVAAAEAQTDPTPEILADAPLLCNWLAAIDFAGVLCLAGTVSGHPRLEDGKRIFTSVLVALDPGGAWARSRSRWYRLDTEWPTAGPPEEVTLRGYTWLRRDDAVHLAKSLRFSVLNRHGRQFDA
ncbi:DUF6634 family protein [Paracoccus sp. IB05]|uniref:DUF6634 family protein n=1 Tax=Paracoccus sp. IB05 TaxID=2779367 RepID=UPI0018E71AF1|nr:DUF6634 family protein [Paracoccus sp. IB05]MBJ2152674.1 hypothetical protein [Paracoccus sp. IB05]